MNALTGLIMDMFKVAAVVTDSLTGVHKAMKCLFVISSGCVHKRLSKCPRG
jgi:hypothetical protein